MLTQFVLTSILLHTIHFVGDYYFQPWWMKLEKVENTDVLSVHAFFYFCIMFLGLFPFMSIWGWKPIMIYSMFNAIAHWIVDYISSKILSDVGNDIEVDPDDSKPLTRRVDLWKPICFLGVDQLAHHACLIGLMPILFMGP
jgi:hypothetical protein